MCKWNKVAKIITLCLVISFVVLAFTGISYADQFSPDASQFKVNVSTTTPDGTGKRVNIDINITLNLFKSLQSYGAFILLAFMLLGSVKLLAAPFRVFLHMPGKY